MLPSDLINMALDHQWLALSAVVLGAIVRVLKDDSRILTIPAPFRPWLAFGLGSVAACLQLVVDGAGWQEAVTTAIVAPALAIIGHHLGIEMLRGGKEIPVPVLTKRPEDES